MPLIRPNSAQVFGIPRGQSNKQPKSNDGGGGGGSSPYVAKADFVNGVYFAGGVSTTLDSMFQQDTNDWGSNFDLSDVVNGIGWTMEDGYGFAFKGDCLASVLAGCTLVAEFTVDENSVAETQHAYFPFDVITNDFTLATTAFAETADFGMNDGPGGFEDSNPTGLSLGLNKYAATISPTTLAISLNGLTALTKANPFWKTPEWADMFWSANLAPAPGTAILHSVTIYAPQSDEQLAVLSAP